MYVFQQLLQTSLAFVAILLFARVIGKQQVSQLTVYDYINGITIGSIAATIATDEPSKIWQHSFDLIIFAALTYIISYVVLQNRPLRKLLEGEPTIVIHNGKIMEENMKKNRYNMDDLLMQLREKNVFAISDVEYGILETDGDLSVLLRSQKRPLKPEDISVPTDYEGLDFSLVIDGEVIHKSLSFLNLDENWLKKELQKKGVSSIEEVIYAAIDSKGQLYVDSRLDHVEDKSDRLT